jgi:hypothetical protein
MKCDLCTSNLDVFGWASQIQLRRIASSTLQAMDAFTVWSQLLVSTPFSLSMCPPTHVPLNATADAMASKDMAGSGSAAVFPDRSVVWFRFRIHLFGVQSTWDWIGDDMQKHIAAWELFAQYALSYCIESRLPKSRGPISCNQATGNSGRCSIIQLADHAYVRELDRCCSLVRNPPRFFAKHRFKPKLVLVFLGLSLFCCFAKGDTVSGCHFGSSCGVLGRPLFYLPFSFFHHHPHPAFLFSLLA